MEFIKHKQSAAENDLQETMTLTEAQLDLVGAASE
jgi:hypothetical protein